MHEGDGKMSFIPDKIEVQKRRADPLRHSATTARLSTSSCSRALQDNKKHAEVMKKFPDMEHDDPNAISVDPGKTAEILWRFTKAGTFEFACLIPGHREAGMRGSVIVK